MNIKKEKKQKTWILMIRKKFDLDPKFRAD